MTFPDPTPTILWDDDGPDGKTACLEIAKGGNGDWYLSILGENWDGTPLRSDAFRASTSGEKCGLVTTVVAFLDAVGQGDRERAKGLAESLVLDLEKGWSRLPRSKDGSA